MKRILFLVTILQSYLFQNCSRLDLIDYSPKISPKAFLESQHFINIKLGDLEFVLSQPVSSLIVYFVSFYTIYVGFLFLKDLKNQKSRLWWGVGLLLTGIGAVFAGTSYQAFGYEIKCAGKEFCSWTSTWEIIYEIFTGPGMNAFLIASAYSNTTGNFRKSIIYYAIINTALYVGLNLYGAVVPIQFFVSFEFLMAVSTPSVLFFIWLYQNSYTKNKDVMSLYLRNSWIVLILVIVAYVVYMILGITQSLWKNGIWFSENDVLHVGMIYWIYYIHKNLVNKVKDVSI